MNTLAPKKLNASTDGETLCYWIHHSKLADSRTMVLLHGGASNHTRWSEFVANTSLGDSWNFIAPDVRGNGESMTRKNVGIATWCADVLDLLDAEDVHKPLIVGHSLGAHLALHFADRHPDSLCGLVLIDPALQRELYGRSLWVRRSRSLIKVATAMILFFNSLGLRRRNIPVRDLREMDQQTREEIRDADSFEEIAKRYSALGPIFETVPVANYFRQALAMVTPLPIYERIQKPVLALLSGGSTVGSFEANAQEAKRFPQSDLVVLDANHWPLTETPDETREAIEAWVLKTWL